MPVGSLSLAWQVNGIRASDAPQCSAPLQVAASTRSCPFATMVRTMHPDRHLQQDYVHPIARSANHGALCHFDGRPCLHDAALLVITG